MSRRASSGLAGFLHRIVRGLFRKGQGPSELTKRHLRFEPLEGRALLASDLAAITGVVTLQSNPVDGAQVNLWQDDGDGLFDDQVDTPIDTAFTDVNGIYRFDRLPEGEKEEAVAAGEEVAGALWNFLSGVEARAALQ